MIVRAAVEQDIDQAGELLREFHAESLADYGLHADIESKREYLRGYVNNALVLEDAGRVVGVIAGEVVQSPLNGELMFDERIWYVLKGYRGHGVRLLEALEARCKEIGVKSIVMVCMGNSMPERLNKFYNSRGYRLMETHFIKRVE